MNQPDCIFCKFATHELQTSIIWENDEFIAFLDIEPVQKGHMLVIPKNHVSSTLDLDPESHARLFAHVRMLSERVKSVIQPPRVGLVVEGFGVDHAHVHIIPIYKGKDLDSDHKYRATDEELAEMREKLAIKP